LVQQQPNAIVGKCFIFQPYLFSANDAGFTQQHIILRFVNNILVHIRQHFMYLPAGEAP
jgi:hypothetical protein